MLASRSRRHRISRPRTHRQVPSTRSPPSPPAFCTSPTTPRADPARWPSTFARWASPPSPTTSSPARRAQRTCWPSACRRGRRYSSSAPTSLAAEIDTRRSQARSVVVATTRSPSCRVIHPQTGWPDLAEAALAIRGGALWVAANVDRTLPSERGLLPGNGSMVAALRAATDREPQVAGKPQPTLLTDALSRGDFRTSAGGGRSARHRHRGRQRRRPAEPDGAQRRQHRPRRRARSRRRAAQLHRRRPALAVRPTPTSSGSGPHPAWRIEIGEATVTVHTTGSEPRDSLTVVRATANAVWNSNLERPAVRDRRRRRHRPNGTGTVVPADVARSTSVNTDMSTEPDQIRAQIAALLADLPDVEGADSADVDIDSRRRAAWRRRTTCWCRRWSRSRRAEATRDTACSC